MDGKMKHARRGRPPKPPSAEGTNKIKGTLFHLGDGRVLGHGMSALMTPELLAMLDKHNGETPA